MFDKCYEKIEGLLLTSCARAAKNEERRTTAMTLMALAFLNY